MDTNSSYSRTDLIFVNSMPYLDNSLAKPFLFLPNGTQGSEATTLITVMIPDSIIPILPLISGLNNIFNFVSLYFVILYI